jgi:hypothetical protein
MAGIKRRTLDSYFQPQAKKVRQMSSSTETCSDHATYPFAIDQLPLEILEQLNCGSSSEAKVINNQPDLDLLYFKPYIRRDIAHDLFHFLRRALFFYRVQYKIKRDQFETQVNTPRYTTVFGVDESARFSEDGELLDAKTRVPLPKGSYRCDPRPLPSCLESLRKSAAATTGEEFNFCLVNYYASGDDSISYHSDDEQFLGPDPAIASFSLGTTRDFLMKHKPTPGSPQAKEKPLKFALGPGDMVLMRGKTQSCWLHSIPKRALGGVESGRINITLRKAMDKRGTENYYRYNVGDGRPFRWSESRREMILIDTEK